MEYHLKYDFQRSVAFGKSQTQVLVVDVQRAIQEAIKIFGKIDFAFNNAGIEGEQK